MNGQQQQLHNGDNTEQQQPPATYRENRVYIRVGPGRGEVRAGAGENQMNSCCVSPLGRRHLSFSRC